MKKIYIAPETVLHASHAKFGYLDKGLYAGSKGDTTSMMLGNDRGETPFSEDNTNMVGAEEQTWESIW